jgi:hypothetical protein
MQTTYDYKMKEILSARPLSATISRLFLYAQVVPATSESISWCGAGHPGGGQGPTPVGGGGLGVAKPTPRRPATMLKTGAASWAAHEA